MSACSHDKARFNPAVGGTIEICLKCRTVLKNKSGMIVNEEDMTSMIKIVLEYRHKISSQRKV